VLSGDVHTDTGMEDPVAVPTSKMRNRPRELKRHFCRTRPKKLKRGHFLGVIPGLRYYSPGLGRWVSRDPIGERGGVSLYCAMANDALSRADCLGLASSGSPVAMRLSWLRCVGDMLMAYFSQYLALLEQEANRRERDAVFPDTETRTFAVVAQEWEMIAGPARNYFTNNYADPDKWVVTRFFRNGQSPLGAEPNIIDQKLFYNNEKVASAVATLWHESYHRDVGPGHDIWLPSLSDNPERAGDIRRRVDFGASLEFLVSRAEIAASSTNPRARLPPGQQYECYGPMCGRIHVDTVMKHFECLCDPCNLRQGRTTHPRE